MCTCDCGRQQQCSSDRSICFKAINREILHMEIYNHLEKSITSVYPFKTDRNELDVFFLFFWSVGAYVWHGTLESTGAHIPTFGKASSAKLPFEGLLVGAMFCRRRSDVPWNCWKLTSKPCYHPNDSHSYLDPYHVFRVLARLQHVPVRKWEVCSPRSRDFF